MNATTVQKPVQLKVLRPEILSRLPGGGLPAYGSNAAAGADLFAALDQELTLAPGATAFIPTGIAIHMADPGLCALILSRSGLGTKQGLVVKQGVGLIDADYQGEILVALHNISEESRVVKPGDRIAQLMLTPVLRADWVPVDEFTAATVRGAGGFGSTGIGFVLGEKLC